MIVVKIELHSALTKQVTLLGEAIIANDGTSEQHSRGHYDVMIGGKRDAGNLPAIYHTPLRRGRVSDYPRLSYNVWRLVLRAIASAFPEEKVKLPDLEVME
jgi:hypothetical protein